MKKAISNILSEIHFRISSGSARSSNAKKNIAGSLMIKGISILVQLLLVPLTLDYLSEELYGVWLTVSSMVLWFCFFDIGFSSGLKNRLAEAIAKNDFTLGKELVSTTYITLIMIFIPLGIIMELCTPLIDWSTLLNVSRELNGQLINTVQILIVAFVFQMIFNTIASIVDAFQKVALSNSFPVIGNVVSLIIIWILTIYTSPSLKYMAFSISFVPVLVLLVCSLILFNGKLRSIRPSFKSFRPAKIRDLFSLGIKFFIINAQIIVLLQVTNLLISNVSGPDYVTYYNISYRYIGTAQMLFMLVLTPLWPAFTEAYTKMDYSWMINVYRKLYKMSFYVISLIWIMCLASPIVYDLWIGESTHIPFPMTIAVSIYFCIVCWNSFHVMLINGIGKVKLQSYTALIGMIAHIPLSLYLSQYTGAYGVVISMIVITTMYAATFTIQLTKILNKRATGIWIA